MKVAIIGAGLSGLSAAIELLRNGIEVEIFEKHNYIGGMARSINLNRFIFDIGPHIFHTKMNNIKNFIEELLQGDMIFQHYNSKILLDGKLHDFPPTLIGIFKLPSNKLLTIIRDYVLTKTYKSINRRNHESSFKDWMISLIGKTMYETYFESYTKKLWGIDPARLTSEWAPERISIRILTRSFFGNEWQVYPRFGIGMIPNRLSGMVIRMGGIIRTKSKVIDIITKGYKFKSLKYSKNDEIKEASYDAIISTIPITNFSKLLISKDLNLRFRSLICTLLMTKEPKILNGSHWVYLHSKETFFTRIYEPKNISTFLAPNEFSSLCVESVCDYGDNIWKMNARDITNMITDQLNNLGILHKEKIIKANLIRERYAYPVNELGYKDELNRFWSKLDKYDNIATAGRFGKFQYMNMDAAIMDGIKVAKKINSILKKN